MTFCAGERGCVSMEGVPASHLPPSTFPVTHLYVQPLWSSPLHCLGFRKEENFCPGRWRPLSLHATSTVAPKVHPVSLELSVDQGHGRLTESMWRISWL